MPTLSDVIIIGGGVIGCSIAYHLGLAGVRCTVLEREGVAAGASGVAAGMLTVLGEQGPGGPLFELGLASLRMFPETLKALHEATGIDPEYITAGTLRAAFTEEEEQRLQSLIPLLQPSLQADWVKAEDVLQTEPLLSPEIRGALYTPGEHQVRSTRLTQAFAQAAAQKHAAFQLGALAVGFTFQGQRVTGVRLADGSHLTADHIVIAAGAWSGLLTHELGVPIPVRPVRGQILSVKTLPRALRMTVFAGLGYLTPKVDGSVLVGATQEEAGFDSRVTAAGVGWLLSQLSRLAPSLDAAELGPTEVGLRPGSPDSSPILGPLPGWEGISVATGHFRSGILLSPITGKLMAELITQGAPSIPLEPFSLARFE